MDKKEKLKMLQQLDEKNLTKRFLIPLHSEGMKCKNVQYTHGTLEFGKDIIYCTEGRYSNPVYTGVQVKTKKITARTINTLFRQISEAFGEPFRDLGDGKKKDLDEFVLITSYEFTEGAKESLWRSLKPHNLDRTVTCVDGNKLVDLLDRYLPSAFWDQYEYFNKYFHAMKSAFETITDISAIGQREPIPLEEIYVSLKLREKREQKIPEREIEEKEMEKEMDEEVGEKHRIERDKYIKETIFNADAVRKCDKVVIVGGPGSGKTTLLKHLTLKSCKENLETQERMNVPIFITLRQFLESGKNVREYINEVFEQYNFPKAKDFIEKDLKEGKCQLFLDGFDELASKERQQVVIKEIEKLLHAYPKNQFIVTSRTAGYHGELRGFENLEVMEFDDRQIEQFITNWFGKTNPEKAKSMTRTIKENARIQAIARNPLMIAIIAVIYEEDRELPQRRVELYQRCVDVLLSRWDVARRIKNKYDAKAKEKILRKVALDAHRQKERSFTKEELLKKFMYYLPEVRIDTEMVEDVLNEIVQRNVLLKEISIDVYEFLHLSFQEYLAALELREKKDYETLLDNLYEPWWEEVVLLFAGFDRDATGLIKEMKEKKRTNKKFREDIFYSNLMLMGKCIADADYTDVAIREEIVNNLWELYQTGEFSSLRDNAIKILALIKPDSIVDLLLEELKDEDLYFRRKAAVALGEIGHERAVDPLVKALKDKNSSVRRKAAVALGKIGHERAVDPLVDALKDKDSDIREEAAYVLGLIGHERAVDPLVDALKDEDSSARGRAAEALGEIGHEKAVDQLVDALKDKNSDVRGRAAEALGEIGHERAVDQLVDALKDEDSDVRGRAAEALGEIGHERAVDPLVDALKDEDSSARWSVAEALGLIGHERAVDLLVDALKDKDSSFRRSAAFILGEIGHERAVDPLVDALKDEDSSVRGRAAETLGLIGHERAVDPLVDALKDKDTTVQLKAAYALGRIGHERAVDPLVDALKDENLDVRGKAALALGLIGHERAVDPLVDALKDENLDVRGKAAYALGKIGHERAVDPLVDALKDKDSDIREEAAEALGRIGHEKAVDLLVNALKDEDSDVRESAAIALGKIGHERAVDPLKKALKDEGVTIFGKVKDAAFNSLQKISRKSKIKIVMN